MDLHPTLRQELVAAFKEAREAAEAGHEDFVTDEGHADDVIRVFTDWLRTPPVKNAVYEALVSAEGSYDVRITNELCRRAAE